MSVLSWHYRGVAPWYRKTKFCKSACEGPFGQSSPSWLSINARHRIFAIQAATRPTHAVSSALLSGSTIIPFT